MAKNSTKLTFDKLSLKKGYKPKFFKDDSTLAIVEGSKKVQGSVEKYSHKLATLKFGERATLSKDGKMIIVEGHKDNLFLTPTTLAGVNKGIELKLWTEKDIIQNIMEDRTLKISGKITKQMKIVVNDMDLMTAALEHEDTMDRLIEMKEENPDSTRKALLIEIGKDLAKQGLI